MKTPAIDWVIFTCIFILVSLAILARAGYLDILVLLLNMG